MTPGPWKVGFVANEVWSPARKRKPVAITAPTADGFQDARLIAAAPDLLAFAQHVARTMPHDSRIVRLAEAVIAKAEGR